MNDMTASNPPASAPAVSKTEIVIHGLANGMAMMLLGSAVMDILKHRDPYAPIQGGVALLVILLSALVLLRRRTPENRGLVVLERLVSIVVGALGAASSFSMLALMTSGATYKGDSPDAGGMTMFFGLLLYYPSAGLLVLPLALRVSRLPPWLRRTLGWSIPLLVLLPFLVLMGVRLVARS